MVAWPTDDEIAAAGWFRKSRKALRIKSAPRSKQYYWVDFPHDAHAPEFVGEHPGIVLRGARKLEATCIIVPVTSKPQLNMRYVHQLKRNPNPRGRRDGIIAFVICDHLYTVHTCRLRPVLDLNGRASFPTVDGYDFDEIKRLVWTVLYPPGHEIEK